MKKSIALFVAFAFVVTLASVVFGRTLEEEKQAVRDYLKVVDAKIVKYRKAGNTVKMKTLQGEKAGTLRRWEKLKVELTQVTPPPAAVPPPIIKPAPAAEMGGLFGLGMPVVLGGSYINTGKGLLSGSVGLTADWIVADFIGLGPMVGMSLDSVKYTLGAGGYYGGGGLKAIPLRAGGIIVLPSEWLGGLETYLSGGLNYVVYGNNQTSGKIGGEAKIGINVDLGLGLRKTGFELGWGAVRSSTVTSKGIMFMVSQPIIL